MTIISFFKKLFTASDEDDNSTDITGGSTNNLINTIFLYSFILLCLLVIFEVSRQYKQKFYWPRVCNKLKNSKRVPKEVLCLQSLVFHLNLTTIWNFILFPHLFPHFYLHLSHHHIHWAGSIKQPWLAMNKPVKWLDSMATYFYVSTAFSYDLAYFWRYGVLLYWLQYIAMQEL